MPFWPPSWPPLVQVGAAALVLILGMVFWEGWRRDFPPERSVAEEFAAQLDTIGIRSIYPPTEDVHVGDVWAVFLPAAERGARVGLLSRGVRVGHVNLLPEILASGARHPVFRSQEGLVEHLTLPVNLFGEAAQIPLHLVSFPKVTRRLTGNLSVGAAAGDRGIGASVGERIIESVDVFEPTGYGLDALSASLALRLYCASPEGRCSERFLRRTLRQAFGRDVVQQDAEIQVVLINYLFMTRRIGITREREASTRASYGAPDSQSGEGPPVAPAPGKDGVTASVDRARASTVKIDRPFVRPVAVGFRGVFEQASIP